MNPESTPWSLSSILAIFRRFWWVVLACTLIGGGTAFALSASTTPQFQSTSSLFFTLSQGGNAVDLNQGSTYTQNQMLSFAQLATSSKVLQPVIDELDLDTTPKLLARSLTISIPQSTVILEVRAISPDPETAADIAAAVSSSLVDVVAELAPTASGSSTTVRAEIIDRAVVPTIQALPNKALDTAIGLFLGLLVGVLVAFALSAIDTRIRTPEALAAAVGKPVLGTVSRTRMRPGQRPLSIDDPIGTLAEEMRRIRQALAYASLSHPIRSLLVTSAVPGEGKSTVAINLSIAFSSMGTVLLIDADLRKPRVADYTGTEGSVGLTSVLLGEVELDVAAMRWGTETLSILPSGILPPSPADVLGSPGMRALVAGDAETAYDLRIVDSPPVLTVADTTLLGPIVDGVVVVVDARRSRRAQVLEAVRGLEASGARILGMVLSGVKESGVSKARYYTDAAPGATTD